MNSGGYVAGASKLGLRKSHTNSPVRCWRISLWHPEQNCPFTRRFHIIPHSLGTHTRCVYSYKFIIGVIFPVPESIEPQLSGILSSSHGSPCWNGDRRIGGVKRSPNSILYQRAKMRQVQSCIPKHQTRRNSVESDYHHSSILRSRNRNCRGVG